MINPRELINGANLVWLFNINQEQRWNDCAVFPSVTDVQKLELVYQQEQLLLFIADERDTVFFCHKSDEQFLEYLREQGVRLPNIVQVPDLKLSENMASNFQNSILVPYIVSEETEELVHSIPEARIFGSHLDLVKRINNKFATRKMAITNGFNVTKGYFCTNAAELQNAYHSLRIAGFKKCILKIPYGSSGKGLKIIDGDKSFEVLQRFILRRSKQFELLLEGWHPIGHNINCQLWVDKNRIEILAITEQQIDENAVYQGTCFTPTYSTEILEVYRNEMTRLGTILRKTGYRGICGVDSIIDSEGNLIPIIEVNARFTQVTYLLPIVQQLVPVYQHIVSNFVNFEIEKPVDFPAIYIRLQEVLIKDKNTGFIVYTFAKYTLPNSMRTLYRLFILVFGNDNVKVQKNLEALRNFK
ncbi:ATP-grasp domain-containing protein [Paenibacillus periandrae]|uniref:ATP-grasp domain-containing protein n=1 Tax=Paenibacillus periandrae TaxID=1761741 RepID=UPI001F08C93A|nr:ATP-grasp domain-containing protein [Paenibacillus periandrae]